MAAAGLTFIAWAGGQDSYLWLGIGLALLGFGVGLAMTLTADVVLSAAPPKKAGSVSAITETAYELGIVLGIAILGSLVTGVYRSRLVLPGSPSPDGRTAPSRGLTRLGDGRARCEIPGRAGRSRGLRHRDADNLDRGGRAHRDRRRCRLETDPQPLRERESPGIRTEGGH